MIVLQLNMERADYFIDKIAFQLSQSLQQRTFRFVINDGDGASHNAVSLILLVFQCETGDHVRDRFGTAFEPAFLHQLIEFTEDRVREGNTDALNFSVVLTILASGRYLHWVI